MKPRLIAQAVAMSGALAITAQVNSPANDGYVERGRMMFADKNYVGCIDQLNRLDRSLMTDAELEETDWLLAESAFRTAGASAIAHFKLFLQNYPASTLREKARMRIGDCMMHTSYAGALLVYLKVDGNRLTGVDADDLTYHTAYCRMRLGELDKADTGFGSLAYNAKWGNASRFYMGYISYTRGEYAAARRLLQSVNTATEPGNMADYYLAQIDYIESNYSGAYARAKALLQRSGIEPLFVAETNRVAGESLYHLGNTSQAIPYLRAYVAGVETPLSSTLYILGLSEYNAGNYAEAVRYLQPVTSGNDAMAQNAYLYVGQALLKEGDLDAALMAFDKALHMPYDKQAQESAYYNYAVARFGGGSSPFGSSAATFEAFLKRYPDSRFAPRVQEFIVTGYITDNNYQAALESIERMVNPGEKVLAAKQHILYTLGARALTSGNTAEAIDNLVKAQALAGHDATVAAETQLALGEAYLRNGRNDEAVKQLLAYLRGGYATERNNAVARYDLGYARFGQKDYADAAINFNHVVDKGNMLGAPVTADAYNRLADISYYKGDIEHAGELYAKAYEAYPAAGDYALFQQAVMKGYTRDYKGKVEGLSKLRDKFPQSSLLPDALIETAEAQIQLGQGREAISTYSTLVSQYPGTSQGRRAALDMALMLLNNNERQQAIDAYRNVVRNYPTSSEAAQAAEALARLAAEDGTLEAHRQFLAGIADAPRLETGEAEQLAYDAAIEIYQRGGGTARLAEYVKHYPQGTYEAQALTTLMDDAVDKGNKSDAARYAAVIVERYPDSRGAERALLVTADSRRDNADGEGALKAYRTLAAKASTPAMSNAARVGIMRVARDLADYDAVIDAADALLASSTLGAEDKNEAIFSRGLALAGKDRTAEAQAAWQSIAANTDDLHGAKSAYYLAQSQYDAGDIKAARVTVEKFIDSGTPHAYWLARGFVLLSDIYSADGKDFEAREYLEALRKNYPGTDSDIFRMIDSRLNK